MAPYEADLPTIAGREGLLSADLNPAICTMAGLMNWSNRDPVDRIIAATARHYGLPLVSADTKFDGLVTRLW